MNKIHHHQKTSINDTTIIILTRNEINGVKATVPHIPKHLFKECLAVDYQSNDGTREFLKSQGIKIISQIKPGRGEAFKLGVSQAKGTYLVFFSPDGNEDPTDIPKLIHQLNLGADLVIASRFMKGARNEEDDQRIKLRAWANRLFTLIINLLWRGNMTDSINGYRAITKKRYQELELDATGFAVEFQMSIRALKLHYKIAEIPTREGNRIGGFSRSYALPTGLAFLRLLYNEIKLGKQFINPNNQSLN